MFCPFVKGECNYKCVMCNNCYEENDIRNCMLRSAVDTIISFGNGIAPVNKKIENVIEILNHIKSNTGSDQTDSFEIKNQIEDIKSILEEKLTEQ